MMTMLIRAGVTGLLFLAAPALADSPFDGTWKGDLQSAAVTEPPSRYMLGNGTYRCESCKPTAYAVPADGQYHRVAGRPYWDEMAVTVVDDHTVRYGFRKDGREISTSTNTISADGRTLSVTSHNTNNGGSVPVDSTASASRVGAPVAGAHLMSGGWQFGTATSLSDAALTISFRVDGNRFHQETGMGESLDAVIGGPYALNQGDPGRTMTKVTRVGPRALRFTDMRGGRVVGMSTWTVSTDGRRIDATSRDLESGGTGRFHLNKQ